MQTNNIFQHSETQTPQFRHTQCVSIQTNKIPNNSEKQSMHSNKFNCLNPERQHFPKSRKHKYTNSIKFRLSEFRTITFVQNAEKQIPNSNELMAQFKQIPVSWVQTNSSIQTNPQQFNWSKFRTTQVSTIQLKQIINSHKFGFCLNSDQQNQ